MDLLWGFNSTRRLRQGCPLSPFFVLLIVEGLSMSIKCAKKRGDGKRIKFLDSIVISHLLFVDDIMIFGQGSSKERKNTTKILDIYYKSSVKIKKHSSCFGK